MRWTNCGIAGVLFLLRGSTLGLVSIGKTVAKLGGCSLLGGVLLAGMMFPVAGGFGLASNKAAQTVENTSAQLIEGEVPAVTTMVDVNGDPLAWIYDQRRFEVPSDRISNDMKLAIVSVEDRRFADHDGVDWQGTARAFLTNTTSGQIEQGASTLVQQYVKNYQLLVLAQNDAERRAAIETTPARKIREIRMALELDSRLSKEEILTRYLNLVPFGNGAYGVQEAAQTYFGINATDLNPAQSAMLAGIVQSSSALNPYTNPERVLNRRNVVLDTMIENIPERAEEFRAAKEEPLGVLPEPKMLPQGCIAADDRGFFCDYVMQYLASVGIPRDQVTRGGYLIQTTLDPDVQDSAVRAVRNNTSPQATGVANVLNLIQPGSESHRVLAMASSRVYGLDGSNNETVSPQTFSMVGHGAGSIFKIFPTAAALEQGMGIDTWVNVPARYEARGMGYGGAPGCPPATYCVENYSSYKPSMSLTEALATSPNTTFIGMIEQAGVEATVDMAVRLGLRSYTRPGSSGYGEQSLAEMVADQNQGSFTLGPVAVNPLELSNVAATLASDGMWCPPTPVDAIIDRYGNAIEIAHEPCEQVVEPGLATALSQALGQDHTGVGTAARAAGATGWTAPVSAKTGTTNSNYSAGFLGYTNTVAGVSYIYGDSPTPSPVCSFPVRQCYSGNLFGGNEPAQTWFQAVGPVASQLGPIQAPQATDRKYVSGDPRNQVPNVAGLTQSTAIRRLESSGYSYNTVWTSSAESRGVVTSYSPNGFAAPGATITLYVSDGSQRVVRPSPPRRETQAPATPARSEQRPELPDSVEVPGLPEPMPVPNLNN
ncbi:Penicillin-binding protein 1 [Hoyosella subflava DQS3-9A1]|uniref:Penicillin-binding protein 1 n=1 Tax=Hoyosella subflava (strain DSM 45089 / JCM 17490 / NBRC 109087 / DQS3-9A1) TaxID=443218 RepID=F6EG10_HOYSD|nr:Penicillin-binding protein 1 [Hoyosella subflava DQS3-9A1]